ncbi:MAG: tRNA (N(6)-L-threonylcarbamoyladenosine(37)-C(2))-methylthiotransferase MtaB [Lachnospiraceae bacterium]|nr:tRNA (N(6)-L-threonylcarbamoyladenosine(37)-C(2))-methylthiotransferase MtaB [Lachnospiraceae bacterium]
MKSVALHNLGCKVNGYEMDVMQQILQERGYKIVPFDEVADIYIVNTCTVTNIADRKSRQMLHRAKKLNPDAVVVAVGCYVQTGEDAVKKDAAIDLAIGNNRKRQLVSILEDYLNNRESEDTIIDINHTDEYEEMTLTKTAEHTRAYIKIQDGCNQFCSYCIIPYARGRIRSRREEDILHEVKGIVAAGYKEIVLTGIHISSYGIDRGASELLTLLAKLNMIDGLKRIRLGSLEPRIVTEEFVQRISAMPKICPHFHLSMQSGCDAVLGRMNRHYTSGEYFRTTEIIRKYYPNPAITTDVIVGFPGETEEEFDITERFVRSVNFYEMHIFKYSKRQGTKAAMMDGQLTEAEKSRRSAILAEAERQMSHAYRAGYIGSETEVLVEEKKEKDGRIFWVGHTPQYVKAAKEADRSQDLVNQIIKGTIVGFLEDDVMILK